MIDRLYKLFDERKNKLIDMMENSSVSIEIQHQIYGAVLEIDTIQKEMDNLKSRKI